MAQILQAGDSVTVRGELGVLEHLQDALLHLVTHDVLPAACLFVHVLKFQTNDVGEQTLSQAVLTHHLNRLVAAFLGQFEVAVRLNGEQAVLLHACHSLGNGRAGVLESFSDARTHGDDALFLQFEDGAQIHLCGIDEVCHISLPAITATVLR